MSVSALATDSGGYEWHEWLVEKYKTCYYVQVWTFMYMFSSFRDYCDSGHPLYQTPRCIFYLLEEVHVWGQTEGHCSIFRICFREREEGDDNGGDENLTSESLLTCRYSPRVKILFPQVCTDGETELQVYWSRTRVSST